MRRVFAVLLAVMTVCLMAGCGTEVELDVPRFNRISRAEVEKMLGEPVEEMEIDWWKGPMSGLNYEYEDTQLGIVLDKNGDRVISMTVWPGERIPVEGDDWNKILSPWNIRIARDTEIEDSSDGAYAIRNGINGGIDGLLIFTKEDGQGGCYLERLSLSFDSEFQKGRGE